MYSVDFTVTNNVIVGARASRKKPRTSSSCLHPILHGTTKLERVPTNT